MDITKQRNFLLTENIEELDEMAKLVGPLKDAIEAVLNSNPDLDGLELKKAIKGDKAVQDALGLDELYDNQLNKFIATVRGTRPNQQLGRKATPRSAKTDISSDTNIPLPSLSKILSEPGFMDDGDLPSDEWNTSDEDDSDNEVEPTSKDIDNTIAKDIPSSKPEVGTSNNFKNIIVKKVDKIENPVDEESRKRDMTVLKQFIQKPEVVKALGKETIRNLVSSIIG